jgi:hypothetical protein
MDVVQVGDHIMLYHHHVVPSVQIGGVERAYSTPAASAMSRHQYIALKQIGNRTKWGDEKASSQVPMELWLLWRPPWLNAIFVSGSCRENCRIALKVFPAHRTFFQPK